VSREASALRDDVLIIVKTVIDLLEKKYQSCRTLLENETAIHSKIISRDIDSINEILKNNDDIIEQISVLEYELARHKADITKITGLDESQILGYVNDDSPEQASRWTDCIEKTNQTILDAATIGDSVISKMDFEMKKMGKEKSDIELMIVNKERL
jgi:hypothetical protein